MAFTVSMLKELVIILMFIRDPSTVGWVGPEWKYFYNRSNNCTRPTYDPVHNGRGGPNWPTNPP